MNKNIKTYVDHLFEPYAGSKSVDELKHDLLVDLHERYEELRQQGNNEADALTKTLESIGDIKETLNEMANSTSMVDKSVHVDFKASALQDADFSNVVLHDGELMTSALQNTNFSGSDLTGSSFKSSDLQGANFDRANLTNCNLSTLSLKDASFRETILNNTNFSKSWLKGARFQHVKLVNVNFSMVDFKDVSFEHCTIDGCNFDYADLHDRNFDDHIIRNVQFGKAALENISFKRATLKNVSFKPPFALTNKYYKAIKTIQFDGAYIDKLSYNALRSLGANLNGVTIL